MNDAVATILHADMDAFYAAVEQRDCPELRGKPVIVGARSPRGVVLTASYEARPFGVHSAMPSAQAHQLCPSAIFVPPRMSHYVAVAREIRAVFEEFTPEVEPLSLDEAFLDITSSLRLFHGADEIGRQLKRRVREVTDLTVSVGIGPTKMIAKIASARCKPDGLLEVTPEDVERFLRPLPVNDLWGVGPATHAQLLRMGLTTVGALADCDRHTLETRLGSLGAALWELAHGRDRRVVDPGRERKSCGEEQTFDRDLRDGEPLRQTIRDQADAVARRLRTSGWRGRTVTLKIKLAQRIGPGKYPILTRSETLPAPVDDGPSIAAAALRLWDGVKSGKTIRLVGVSVRGMEAEPVQMPLFTSTESKRRSALNRALDDLTSRFGRDAVSRGRPK